MQGQKKITSYAYEIFTRVGEVSEIERVRFLILHQRVWKSRTKRFPCCNLFILYILRFSHPQKRTTRVYRKYFLVKAARQSYPPWPRKSPRKHNSLTPWFAIGRNDFFMCEKLVSPLWLVEEKSETLFHTAKFDAKCQERLNQTCFWRWIWRCYLVFPGCCNQHFLHRSNIPLVWSRDPQRHPPQDHYNLHCHHRLR